MSKEHCEGEGCPEREKSTTLQLLSLLRTEEGQEGDQWATESPVTEKRKMGSSPTDSPLSSQGMYLKVGSLQM